MLEMKKELKKNRTAREHLNMFNIQRDISTWLAHYVWLFDVCQFGGLKCIFSSELFRLLCYRYDFLSRVTNYLNMTHRCRPYRESLSERGIWARGRFGVPFLTHGQRNPLYQASLQPLNLGHQRRRERFRPLVEKRIYYSLHGHTAPSVDRICKMKSADLFS